MCYRRDDARVLVMGKVIGVVDDAMMREIWGRAMRWIGASAGTVRQCEVEMWYIGEVGCCNGSLFVKCIELCRLSDIRLLLE